MKVVHNLVREGVRLENALEWERSGKWDVAIEVYRELDQEKSDR